MRDVLYEIVGIYVLSVTVHDNFFFPAMTSFVKVTVKRGGEVFGFFPQTVSANRHIY